jgi:hypothetical protein
MRLAEIKRNPEERTLREFASALIFFGLLAAFRTLASGPTFWRWLLMAAGAAGIVSLAAPRLLRMPYLGAMYAALPIGWVISRLLLAVLYYTTFAATAFILRVAGIDRLARKRPRRSTYWVPRQEPRDMNSYLREF